MSDVILTVNEPLYINIEKQNAQVIEGPAGQDGAPGKSAYELAVENGFVGTLQEWLESLEGPQGPTGPIPIGGIELQTTANSTSYEPIVIKTDNVQSEGFPNYKFLVTRFDGVNGVDPRPNLVVREGFNPGVTPPTGEISIEDATEYYYNLNTQNPAVIVAEKHWEFRPKPESGRPTQRWLTFAGRHDGMRTEFGYTADYITVRNSNNTVVKLTDHSLAGRSVETYPKGVQFIAQTNDITIQNNLRVSGLGNIYNDNGNDLNFGTSTNRNISIFNGSSGAGGAIIRLNNPNYTTGFGLKINTFPALLFIDEATGNSALTLFTGAPNNSIVVRASGNIGLGGQGSPVHPVQHNNGAHLTAAGAWTNASDKAYKSNIKPTKYGINDLLKLRPVEYVHKTSGLKQIGLIAQEVEKIMPEFVSGTDGQKGINYSQMVAVLINAIKELNERIKTH